MLNWENITATLKGALKSWSVWFAALLAALPEVLPMVQANFATIAPFIPTEKHDLWMRLIALGVLILRLKTNTSLANKGRQQT